MKRLFLLLFAALPMFGADYTTFRKGGFNEWVIIGQKEKTRDGMAELGEYFRELNKDNPTAFVYIYDDAKAAAMWDRIDYLTAAESDFYDKHFVGVFWKGPGENTRYDFTIMLDGLNGKTETIKYDRADDKKASVNAAADLPQGGGTQDERQDGDAQEAPKRERSPVADVLPLIVIGAGIYLVIKRNEKKNYVALIAFCGAVVFLFALPQNLNAVKTVLLVILIAVAVYFSKQGKMRNQEREINKGNLPVVPFPNGLVLTNGEVCHLSEKANHVEIKNVVIGRQGRSGGISTRLMKGVYLHSGRSQSVSVRGNIGIRTPGIFSITNQRVVFSCPKGAFNRRLSEITSLVAYDDGIGIQFDGKYYTLQLRSARIARALIQWLLNGKSASEV